MRNSTWSLPAYDEVSSENDIMCLLEEGRCLPVEQLLFDDFAEIPGRTWKSKLESCTACKCCPRHQVNKPDSFVPWVDTPFNNDIQEIGCECKCRHNARWICRQVPKVPQVEDAM